MNGLYFTREEIEMVTAGDYQILFTKDGRKMLASRTGTFHRVDGEEVQMAINDKAFRLLPQGSPMVYGDVLIF